MGTSVSNLLDRASDAFSAMQEALDRPDLSPDQRNEFLRSRAAFLASLGRLERSIAAATALIQPAPAAKELSRLSETSWP